MTDDAGNLSIDFLAGFTIFMIAFIYVATMIPGLLIGLQSKTIDYDAVAYRTGVILAEDPGMPFNDPQYGGWESLPNTLSSNVLRFGLALSKDTPNILSPKKIDRFFCETAFVDPPNSEYPNYYRSRAVFGDYPYQFNISLKIDGKNSTRSIGDPLPDGYGYSRRVVKIKEESSATIDGAQLSMSPQFWSKEPDAGNKSAVDLGPRIHPFSIYFNYTDLTGNGPYYNSHAYQIDPISPLDEGVTINLINLNKTTRFGSGETTWGDPDTTINLTSVIITKSWMTPYLHTRSSFATVPVSISDNFYYVYIDGNTTPLTSFSPPYNNITNNVTLVIPPGATTGLNFLGGNDPSTYMNVTLQFGLSRGDWFLNSTKSQPYRAFVYNYDPANVTQPQLRDGVLEVAVW